MPFKDLEARRTFMKEYRLKNKAKIKEYNREYYVKNIKSDKKVETIKNDLRQYVKTVGGKIKT